MWLGRMPEMIIKHIYFFTILLIDKYVFVYILRPIVKTKSIYVIWLFLYMNLEKQNHNS